MAVPRVILFRLRPRGRQTGLRGGIPAIGRRRQQLLIDSGRVLTLLGALVLVHQLSTTAPAMPNNDAGVEHALLLGFLLWLLGAAVAMLSLVAGRFPRLVAAVAAIALALRGYLFGGV
ncbi:unnamed protein product [Urochloa humidicola]